MILKQNYHFQKAILLQIKSTPHFGLDLNFFIFCFVSQSESYPSAKVTLFA